MRAESVVSDELPILEMDQDTRLTGWLNDKIEGAVAWDIRDMSDDRRWFRCYAGGAGRWRRCPLLADGTIERRPQDMESRSKPGEPEHACTSSEYAPEKVPARRLRTLHRHLPALVVSILLFRELITSRVDWSRGGSSSQKALHHTSTCHSSFRRSLLEKTRYQQSVECRKPSASRASEEQSKPAEEEDDIGTIEVWPDAPAGGQEKDKIEQGTAKGRWTREESEQRGDANGHFARDNTSSKQGGMRHRNVEQEGR